jgi:hypothetical protein
MKCSLCGKKGVTLAHWRTAHKDWLRRKMNSPAARAKAAETRRRKKAQRGAGKAPRTTKGHRRPHKTSGMPVDVPEAPAGFIVESVTYKKV